MADFEITIDNSGLKEVKNELKKITSERAEIGLFDPEQAQIGFDNEFGLPHQPPRPFIKPTMENNKDKYIKTLTNQFKLGEIDLAVIGEECAKDMVQYVVDLKEPPNAALTIKIKGFDDPLIDTGAMCDAITSKVAKIFPNS